jgi:hypothetical protein
VIALNNLTGGAGMQRIKIVGLTVIAVLATSAVAAGSASATLPEFSGGEVFAISGGAVKLEAASSTALKVTCKSQSGLGHTHPPQQVEMEVRFQKCAGPLRTTCTSLGQSPGEILYFAGGYLGYINKAKHQVGVDFLGAEPGVGFIPVFAEFLCANKTEDFVAGAGGSVVGRFTPINKSVSTLKLTLKQALGKETPESLEGQTDPELLAEVILPSSEHVLSKAGVAYTQTLTSLLPPVSLPFDVKG